MISLIATQDPRQDLGMIAQVLMGQGFVQQPASERAKNSNALVFYTENKSDTITMKFYQDIGTLRVEAQGALAEKIVLALGQYMEALTAQTVAELFDAAQSDMERRIYAILLVLAYPNAAMAMRGLHDKYIKNGNDATREGIVQGFAFLETPDVGVALESIEAEFKGLPLAALCRRGIDSLSERGVIRESLGSFSAKIRAMVDTNAAEALALLEKYCEDNPDAAALRALHARLLVKLGRTEEATALLASIELDAPDAPEAFVERAKIREAQKYVDQAMRDIQCAMTCDPSNEEAQLIYRRLCMFEQQDSATDDQKLIEYTRALDENPDDAGLLCQRAECLMRLGEYEKAKNDALHIKKVAPNDQRLPRLLGEAWLCLGMLGCALEQASIAQKTFMANEQVAASLLKVRVFMALNRIEAARHALRELPPEIACSPEVVLYSGILSEIEGKGDEAARQYSSLSAGEMDDIIRHMPPRLYVDVPKLRDHIGDSVPPVHAPLENVLDQEMPDPYFKRCDQCGALTMGRRTFCKECGSATFFN